MVEYPMDGDAPGLINIPVRGQVTRHANDIIV